MVSGGKIVMDGGSKIGNSCNGQQQRRYGQQDGKAVVMGNRTAIAQ
jgi:hypothetical protein